MNGNMKEYLCHMTDAEKKAYNAEYYRNHKNYWQDYYSKGQTVGRKKYVTEGNGGINRRGYGLGTGPVGKSSGKRFSLTEHHTTLGSFPVDQNMGDPYAWIDSHTVTTPNEIHIPGEQAIKKFGKNLVSDIKTGQKAMIDAGKQFAKDWISGAKSLFKRNK